MRTVFVLMEGKPQEDLSRGALSFDLGEQTAKGQDQKQSTLKPIAGIHVSSCVVLDQYGSSEVVRSSGILDIF